MNTNQTLNQWRQDIPSAQGNRGAGRVKRKGIFNPKGKDTRNRYQRYADRVNGTPLYVTPEERKEAKELEQMRSNYANNKARIKEGLTLLKREGETTWNRRRGINVIGISGVKTVKRKMNSNNLGRFACQNDDHAGHTPQGTRFANLSELRKYISGKEVKGQNITGKTAKTFKTIWK